MMATPAAERGDVAAQLRDLARAVRGIGNGYRCDPEQIAAAKDQIATELAGLARSLERAA